ncbi:MAG: aldehyde dehydrogenase family protein [Methanospirillum sp.]|nr:aldehyde dehydrogenase family protein [Methanospirillum sp.]
MDPYPLIIGGTFRHSSPGIPVLNPYTGRIAGEVSGAGRKEAEEALRTAEHGAEIMAAVPSHRRSAILHRLADLMEESSGELADIIIREGGKVRRLASAEVSRAIGTIRISAEEALRIRGEVIPLDSSPAGEGRIGILTRFPVGIVLAITPFNLPLNQICHKAGPAFAAGNACIIKPASATPLIALKFGELLLKAGMPPEAVHVLPCAPEIAELLATDRRIGCLSFTGSPAVGWHLRRVSPAGKVVLELGGNAAVIVHEDTDIPAAASRIVEGAFSHAGQVCISVQRVYVHRPVFHALSVEIVRLANLLVSGDPDDPVTDIGPMISREKAEEAMGRITDAVAGGAAVLCGGILRGSILSPTVMEGTDPDMEVNCAEVFAPVLTITPYDLFEDAVAMVNASRYGLQAGVYTRDMKRAFDAYRDIRAGAVIINDIPTFRIDCMPYGGVKESGTGREGPLYAISEMTQERLMIIRT